MGSKWAGDHVLYSPKVNKSVRPLHPQTYCQNLGLSIFGYLFDFLFVYTSPRGNPNTAFTKEPPSSCLRSRAESQAHRCAKGHHEGCTGPRVAVPTPRRKTFFFGGWLQLHVG